MLVFSRLPLILENVYLLILENVYLQGEVHQTNFFPDFNCLFIKRLRNVCYTKAWNRVLGQGDQQMTRGKLILQEVTFHVSNQLAREKKFVKIVPQINMLWMFYLFHELMYFSVKVSRIMWPHTVSSDIHLTIWLYMFFFP